MEVEGLQKITWNRMAKRDGDKPSKGAVAASALRAECAGTKGENRNASSKRFGKLCRLATLG
jgi:hypothetical protein